jgi:hypothetical protein
LKKLKSWEPFWSYQETSLPIWPIYQEIRQNGLCCIAGSFQTAPRILISSTAMGAKPELGFEY